MPSIADSNDAFSALLKSRILKIPAKALHATARSVFIGSVRMTIQDSGEAAASWNISKNKGDFVPEQKSNPVVGVQGEKRSQSGNLQPVINLMTAEFNALMPNYESLMGVPALFLTNPISGNHQLNAQIVPAASFSLIDAPDILNAVTQAAFNAE